MSSRENVLANFSRKRTTFCCTSFTWSTRDANISCSLSSSASNNFISSTLYSQTAQLPDQSINHTVCCLYDTILLLAYNVIHMQELHTANRSWHASSSTTASSTTDDHCKQQVPSITHCLQQQTTPAMRWQSCSVYNSWQHWWWDDSRAWFTTADNTGDEMTVMLGLQQLWSEAKSNRTPY